jgi:hypothetical protein
LELRTLSTWHSNQQVDGGHYEAEAEESCKTSETINSKAQSASKEKLESYYKELSTILTKYNLHDKPEHIFNVDETSVTTEHSPSKMVCNKETKPQAITSGRSSTVTIIAGGNAIGNSLPPYFVFSGKRWNSEFL